MGRQPRLDIADIPQHIIQRGNNRNICFVKEIDMATYAYWLKVAAQKYEVAIHAWVFMTNHVHLLATPKHDGSVGKMMQSLGRQYVRYFNYTYQRTGTLWEGRYKSCLVDSDTYLFDCYRYIELNPVRAKMVKDPAEYRWSSYATNALGKRSTLCEPHPLYVKLGKIEKERLENYRKLFDIKLDDSFTDNIRTVTQKGIVLGREDFIHQVELLSGRRVGGGALGRPRKNVL